ncbi:hypothetical protein [Qipengyuania flava]|uniref:hypothetical protein n=1 Tax=Qipengyuania flava TaxID=192812 RepID=UPI001CD2936E|nr:hypothetical protein [Qipengyuania flava]MCA0891259.1 hypothetical protein [Qipengyuania flava]
MADPLLELAHSLRVSKPRARAIVAQGFIADHRTSIIAQFERTLHLAPDVPLGEQLAQVLDSQPPFQSRKHAKDWGDLLRLSALTSYSVPRDRIEEALLIIRGPDPRSLQWIHRHVAKLICAHEKDVLSVILSKQQQVQLEPLSESVSALAEACGFTRVVIERFARLGILSATAPTDEQTSAPCDIPLDMAFETLSERLHSLPRAPFTLSRGEDVRKVRCALGIDRREDFPPNIIEDCIDWRQSLGQTPSTSLLEKDLYAPSVQVRRILKERRRKGETVVIGPVRAEGTDWDLEALRNVVHPLLQHAPDTALDGRDDWHGTMPHNAAISTVADLKNPVLRILGQVLILFIYGEPKFRSYRGKFHVPLRRLDDYFGSLDPRKSGDVARVLEAAYQVGIQADERVSALMGDIMAWPNMVSKFELYLSKNILPANLRTFLESHRPALPAGDNHVVAKAIRTYELVQANHREKTASRLAAALEDPDKIGAILRERRSETKALRNRVAEIIEERREEWEEVAREDRCFAFEHRLVAGNADGVETRRNLTMELMTWEYLTDRVEEVSGLKQELNRNQIAQYQHEDAIDLFENEWVLRYVDCKAEDGSEATPPYWFQFHSSGLFHNANAIGDDLAAIQAAMIVSTGLTRSMLSNRAGGLGQFKTGHNSVARRALMHLGWTMLPLDEHDHFEAFALYCGLARLERPVRPGEQIAYRFEEVEGYSDDQSTHAVFNFHQKYKTQLQQHLTSHETEEAALELIYTTERRILAGKPLEPCKKPIGAIDRAPAVATYVTGYKDQALGTGHADTALALMLIGHFELKGSDWKKIWTARAKKMGQSPDEIRQAHGHSSPVTIEKHYDLESPSERDEKLTAQLAANAARTKAARKSHAKDKAKKVAKLESREQCLREKIAVTAIPRRGPLLEELAVVRRELKALGGT